MSAGLLQATPSLGSPPPGAWVSPEQPSRLEDIFTGINVTLPSSAQRLQIVAQPAELGSPPQDVQVESCFSNRKERTKQVDTLEINTVEREATGEHLQSSHYQLGSLASVLCHTASVSPRSGGTCSGGAEVDPNSDSKGGKKSKGGRRDSDKPKRPRTAYLLFAEDCRRGLKKTDPALSFTATSQMVSKEWKELAETKKVQYQRTAEKEQEKHRVAKAQWEAKQVLEGEQALAMERSLALEGSLALGGLLAVDGSLEGAGSLVVEGEGSLEGEGAEEVPVGEDVVPDQGGVLTSLEVAVA